MRVRDLAAAESDLDDALPYYADIDRGLAEALLREVVSAKNGIARFPDAWRQLGGGLRSYALHRFPYSIVYRARQDEILIGGLRPFQKAPWLLEEAHLSVPDMRKRCGAELIVFPHGLPPFFATVPSQDIRRSRFSGITVNSKS